MLGDIGDHGVERRLTLEEARAALLVVERGINRAAVLSPELTQPRSNRQCSASLEAAQPPKASAEEPQPETRPQGSEPLMRPTIQTDQLPAETATDESVRIVPRVSFNRDGTLASKL
jgi:hypothetical protein